MKKELKKTVIGARCTAALVGCAMLACGVALVRMYPAAVLGGVCMWALGNALVWYGEWRLQRWKALRREERKRI